MRKNPVSLEFSTFGEMLSPYNPLDHMQYIQRSNSMKYKICINLTILADIQDFRYFAQISTTNIKRLIIEHYFQIEFKVEKAQISN